MINNFKKNLVTFDTSYSLAQYEAGGLRMFQEGKLLDGYFDKIFVINSFLAMVTSKILGIPLFVGAWGNPAEIRNDTGQPMWSYLALENQKKAKEMGHELWNKALKAFNKDEALKTEQSCYDELLK